MKKFNLFVKNDELSVSTALKVKENLIELGFKYDELNPELVIVVGGDGTFLMAIHKYLDDLDKISFLGVHTGTLGFICDYRLDDLDTLYNHLKNNNATIASYPLLKINTDNTSETYYAFNEVRIENNIHTQILDVYIDDIYFEKFRGSGLCVCTQIGSTAVNRSLGGAVIEHGLNLLQLSEITGIHHREYQSLNSSMILRENAVIKISSDNLKGSVLCNDANFHMLDDVHEIRCSYSDKYVQIARFEPYNYLGRLKNLF